MVTASALKKPPVTPVRKASGANTTTVLVVEPISGRAISPAAANMLAPGAPSSRSCNLRIRCSSMTTASSTTRPTAAARPPRVIMLKLICSMKSTRQAEANTAGSISAVISISRGERRKANSTAPASTAPRAMASRTLAAADVTSSDWS